MATAFLGGAVFLAAPGRVAALFVVPFVDVVAACRAGAPAALVTLLPTEWVLLSFTVFAVDFEGEVLPAVFRVDPVSFFALGAALLVTVVVASAESGADFRAPVLLASRPRAGVVLLVPAASAFLVDMCPPMTVDVDKCG
ncbi:MAG TPA: hypothetical protein VFM07_06815 [Intrasporangium sp.]|nr:hypothetical protein [Intrasporangium sp.]